MLRTQDYELQEYYAELSDWVEHWVFSKADLVYGQQIIEAFKPFIDDLVAHSVRKQKLHEHVENLCLLGNEIIRTLNMNTALQSLPVKQLIADSVDEDGGPYSHALDSQTAKLSYDDTCRSLHEYLERQTQPKH